MPSEQSEQWDSGSGTVNDYLFPEIIGGNAENLAVIVVQNNIYREIGQLIDA